MKSFAFILLLFSIFYSDTISKQTQPKPIQFFTNAYPDTEDIMCMEHPNFPGDTAYKYQTTMANCVGAGQTLIGSRNQGEARCGNCRQYFLDKHDLPVYPSAKTGMNNADTLEFFTRMYMYMACKPVDTSLPEVGIPEDIPPIYQLPNDQIKTPWTIELMDTSITGCKAGSQP